MGDPPRLMSPIYPHVTGGTGLHGSVVRKRPIWSWPLSSPGRKTNLDLTSNTNSIKVYEGFDRRLHVRSHWNAVHASLSIGQASSSDSTVHCIYIHIVIPLDNVNFGWNILCFINLYGSLFRQKMVVFFFVLFLVKTVVVLNGVHISI